MAYLLKLPAARATIDAIDCFDFVFGDYGFTAISVAAGKGHSSIVQLLLDAGADPTAPDDFNYSTPIERALNGGHSGIVTLLRRTTAEPGRARALFKARSLIDAALAVDKVRTDARAKGESPAEQLQKAGVVPAYLKDRVEQQQPMPMIELVATERGHDEQLRATVMFVLGLARDEMPREVFDEWVLRYLLPVWGDNGAE